MLKATYLSPRLEGNYNKMRVISPLQCGFSRPLFNVLQHSEYLSKKRYLCCPNRDCLEEMESGQIEQHIKSCGSTRVYCANSLLSWKYNKLGSHKCMNGLQDALRYYIEAAQRAVFALVAPDHMVVLDESGMKYDLDGDIP